MIIAYTITIIMKKIMENKNLKKNKQISQTMSETRKKRQNQICRVFHVKIQENKLSKLQREQLQMIFVEGKRFERYPRLKTGDIPN